MVAERPTVDLSGGLDSSTVAVLAARAASSASDLVYLQDRVNMHHQRYQTHGSQFFGSSSEGPRLWPVSDPATVNDRRADVDLSPLDQATIAGAWTPDELRQLGCPFAENTT